MSKFEKGDLVRCVDNTGGYYRILTVGKVYEVLATYRHREADFVEFTRDTGSRASALASRFELAKAEPVPSTTPADPPELGGVKFDNGKPPMGLIPYEAQVAEAEVLAFGSQKYNAHNWRGGMAWSRLLDAALRHIGAFVHGQDRDPETGKSHLAHARCCLGFLLAYEATGAGTDDRYKAPV